MAGHFRTVPAAAASKAFPRAPQFSGFMRPNRFEGEVNNLEIVGEMPSEIDGTFYRVMPDPQFPPFVDNDPVSQAQVHEGRGCTTLTCATVVQRRREHQCLQNQGWQCGFQAKVRAHREVCQGEEGAPGSARFDVFRFLVPGAIQLIS